MNNSKKYYLEMEDGSREYVSEKIFKEYWKLVNRENYLKKLDRKQKIQSLNTVDEDGREFAETLKSGIDIENIVEAAERINDVRMAILKLSPKEQEFIKMMFYEGLNETEIAKNEGVSRAAIWHRRKSAFKKLKELLRNL